MPINESHVEEAALEWLGHLGYEIVYGPDIAPGEPKAERENYGEVVLPRRLRAAMARINPTLPAAVIEEAALKVEAAALDAPGLIERSRRFHKMLTDGVDIETPAEGGGSLFEKVWLLDNHAAEGNDFAAVNQFTVIENKVNRRPDIILFVNGIPLAVIELKNAADEKTTVVSAYKQLGTYKRDLTSLLTYNEVLVISDGLAALAGTLSSELQRFQPWRTVDGDVIAPRGVLELETLIRGVFEKRRFIDLIKHFVVYEADGKGGHIKKVAAYHQYHAVNKALACTIEAASEKGDRRAGVVWHTQGSGKSLSMVFYTGKVVRSTEMANPTVVVLTDRNDLDNQLFGTFADCAGLLRQTPVQAESREHLRELLRVASGGVVFTTIQKFMPDGPGQRYPMLTDRRNIVVVADEAHRSQYNFSARALNSADGVDIAYGYAQHVRDALPYASFIGFTGTPIESDDISTRKVFGDTIDVYDIRRAVEDGATVPLYYEARLAKLILDADERPHIDEDFDEITEDIEDELRRKVASKWARTEALVGAENRIKQVAADIVDHFGKRRDAMDGKGMIVCMSRRICVDLYDAIIKIRPEWHSEEDDKGFLKVIMTGSAADGGEWQQHIRNGARRKDLAETYKTPESPLKLVIVRDMWLTGFDAPCAHTMYIDKPMCGHGLMQAIARVNRVFTDKPGGLIVDYLGIAERLKQALENYTAGDREEVAIPIDRAVKEMRERYEVIRGMLHGFDYSAWTTGTASQRLALIPAAMELIEGKDPKDGISRYVTAVVSLTRAFALAMPEEAALALREDVAFFHAIRSGFVKTTVTGSKSTENLDAAVRQIVSKAIVSTEIIDIFRAAGFKSPDISIVSGEFLAELQNMPHKNLAFEFLRKLLNDEIKKQAKTNVVQAKLFSERLEEAIRKYQNRAIDAAEIVTELIDMAKDVNAARVRNEALGLTIEEIAFYDALGTNDTAVQVLGDENLRIITRALVACVHQNATIDWSVKESARANMRVMVKRILRKFGYPPDKADWAVQNIIEQAEALTAQVVE